MNRVDDYEKIFGDLAYQDCLIKYQKAALFIWKQYENKFNVGFGEGKTIDEIDKQM